MTKRITSLLLSLVMLIGLLPMAALAEEYTALIFGEEVTVNVAVGESYWYQFTPTATQSYSFYSSAYEGVDPYAVLYDGEKTQLTYNDDYNERNFRIVWELTAGETYYLEVYDLSKDDEGTMTVLVGEVVPTTVYVDESELARFVGAEFVLETTIYPNDAVKRVTWTSSDESVATVDENGKVTCLAGGEAIITVTTVNGLTDTCELLVVPFDGTVAFGETTFVITDDEASKEQMLAFTPAETGYYRLLSYDNVPDTEGNEIDPRVRVYDEEYNSLAYSDDDGDGVNFCAELFMEAGKTYYCYFSLYYPEATGSYKLNIEKMLNATSVSIDSGDIIMEQGESREMMVTFAPEGCWIENYTLESSDESVVFVHGHSFDAVGAGEVTLTVTTDLGLTDSITVKVNGAIPLTLDTTYTVNGVAEYVGGWEHYCFTPTVSGRYTIASSAVTGENATTYVVLSELGYELRRNETDTASFSLTYELEAGKEYYFDVTVASPSPESSVDFALTKTDNSDISEAAINTDLPVSITNFGDGVYYAFTPNATGEYKIYSLREDTKLDPKLIVFDTDWEEIAYNDDDSETGERDFCLQYEFTAGVTYYLKAKLYDDNVVGDYVMRIEPAGEVSDGVVASGTVSGMENATTVVIQLIEQGLTEPAYEVVLEGNGEYTIEDVLPATYTVKVVAEGYDPITAEVIIDCDTTIDFEMVKEKPEYEVLFYFNEADEWPIFGVNIKEGEPVEEPASPAQEGKVFIGWFLGDELYDFSAPVTGNLKIVAKFEDVSDTLKGDVNLDGVVDMMDAFAVYRTASGADESEDVQTYGDMNDDGIIDMVDAFAVYRIASGAA